MKATTQKRLAGYVLKYAKLVQMNVRNTPIQIIVDNVLRYVANVQKNVVGFQGN
jgi:hypothetical protein